MRLRRPRRRGSPVDAGARRFHDATITTADRSIVERALPLTITGEQRLQALVDAVRYCARRGVPGAFVECGVWLGGSALAIVLTLLDEGVSDRDIHLYDTFEGMTEPSAVDVSPFDPPAMETWETARRAGEIPWPEYFANERFDIDTVRSVLVETGYPPERLHLVPGRVEDTLPARAPGRVALLRLDTDWYDSTMHELEHLFPRLEVGGVLIVDDYGHWEGARRAVDEYLATRPALLMHRVDYSARMLIKQDDPS